MIGAISALSRALSFTALCLAGAGLVAMTAILVWQVFARYVLNAAPAWSEQAALVILLYFVLLAAAVGVREGFHIGMTMGVDALPPRWAARAHVLSMMVVAGFGALLGINAAELATLTWTHVIPTLGLPRGVVYLPLAAAGWLIVFFACEHILATLRGRKVEPLWS
jgi:TRAP-type C4-dicarboxylate transport system permease small subunit